MVFCEIHKDKELSKNGVCRKCYMVKYLSGYYKENKPELDENNKNWVISNRDRSREIKREWKSRNPNVDKERYEKIKNTPEYKERMRVNHENFNKNNPDYYKNWRKNNPEKKLASDKKSLEKLLPFYPQLKDSWDMAYALSHWADSIKKRDNNTCQNCGSTHKPHAHHILYPKEKYPELVLDLDNGVTFCKECHEIYHWLFGNNL